MASLHFLSISFPLSFCLFKAFFVGWLGGLVDVRNLLAVAKHCGRLGLVGGWLFDHGFCLPRTPYIFLILFINIDINAGHINGRCTGTGGQQGVGLLLTAHTGVGTAAVAGHR